MWIVLAAVVAAWLVLAVAGALLIGRAVAVAERRRPRGPRTRRASVALERIVEVATGAIPVIRPRMLQAVTGALPVIRPRID